MVNNQVVYENFKNYIDTEIWCKMWLSQMTRNDALELLTVFTGIDTPLVYYMHDSYEYIVNVFDIDGSELILVTDFIGGFHGDSFDSVDIAVTYINELLRKRRKQWYSVFE